MTNDENQFIAARAWLLTYADEYEVQYRLTGNHEVRVWAANAPFPLYVYLDGKEWVLNSGPRFHYLHRAVMFMLTEARNTLMGTQYHLDTFGEPCWSGCPC